jgi:transcriptional regulator with XRE-family HTH domain/molybdate-binding protein
MERSSRLREARIAAGLSQSAVASAAGVSRQAVGAIESGLHRPNVDAALAIAGAVGRSVEELFAPLPSGSDAVLETVVASGGAALAARVGDRIVHAAATDAIAFEGWPRANAVMHAGEARLLPGADLQSLVVVGCDPALGMAAGLLPLNGPRSVIALSGSTGKALAAIAAGRAHAALVHGPQRRLPEAPPGALRVHLARWRVGVASRGRRPRSVAELCHRGARVVQRDAGASSQRAFIAAVDAEGGPRPAGPLASGHLEVARLVVQGAAAGVTMEPAAIRSELAFESLEEHVAEVWTDARWREHPAAVALADVLRSAAFTSRLALVGGYELADCGSQVGGLSAVEAQRGSG